jgi:DNA polymerase III delta prime subunit
MPVDYSLGKVYKIVGNGKIYVGSTCERLLCQRLAGHRRQYNLLLKKVDERYVTSYECVSDPECYIELLELCSCSCKDELLKCEAKWIRELECVNKVVPDRTRKEWYNDNKTKILEKQKAYAEQHVEEKKEYAKIYYEIHKEDHRAWQKEYNETNKEHLAQKTKEYYEANKEAILKRHKEYKLKKKSEQ